MPQSIEISIAARPDEWSTALCDCCSEPGGRDNCTRTLCILIFVQLHCPRFIVSSFSITGCYTGCCPSCALGRLAELHSDGDFLCAGNSCGLCFLHWTFAALPCLVGFILFMPLGGLFAWLVTLPVRMGIREKYGIAGNPCFDCLVVTFCETCATCQQYRESVIRGTKPGSALTRSTSPIQMATVVAQPFEKRAHRKPHVPKRERSISEVNSPFDFD